MKGLKIWDFYYKLTIKNYIDYRISCFGISLIFPSIMSQEIQAYDVIYVKFDNVR